VLIGLHPSQSLSDLTRNIKANASKYINDNKWIPGKFEWQEGYGAFTYSRSQLNAVVNYILNQQEHHRKKTFREEYMEFLQKFEIEYDEKYLFQFND
jgi:REP element-mobilizing transposase RayT